MLHPVSFTSLKFLLLYYRYNFILVLLYLKNIGRDHDMLRYVALCTLHVYWRCVPCKSAHCTYNNGTVTCTNPPSGVGAAYCSVTWSYIMELPPQGGGGRFQLGPVQFIWAVKYMCTCQARIQDSEGGGGVRTGI